MVAPDAMYVLVIILSVFLAIFLLVGIISMILIIKLTKQIRDISSTAQTAVSRVSAFANNIAKLSSPTILVDTIRNTVDRLKNDK